MAELEIFKARAFLQLFDAIDGMRAHLQEVGQRDAGRGVAIGLRALRLNLLHAADQIEELLMADAEVAAAVAELQAEGKTAPLHLSHAQLERALRISQAENAELRLQVKQLAAERDRLQYESKVKP
jgi:hypothetical protein